MRAAGEMHEKNENWKYKRQLTQSPGCGVILVYDEATRNDQQKYGWKGIQQSNAKVFNEPRLSNRYVRVV